MNVWNKYEERISLRGDTKREAALRGEKRLLSNKLIESLSYKQVEVDGCAQNTAIINTDNLDTKYIFSMPGEDIRLGGLVLWDSNYWLITEKDFSTEVYTRAKMLQCNYLLKWVDEDRVIHEQWCVVEDGTKYLTGEYEDRNFIVTRGDSRLGMMIAKNSDTVKFNRNSRFLIDDEASGTKLSYALTKPLKVGWQYGGDGVYKFVLTECNSEDSDNHELGIANYYKYFPRTVTTDLDAEGGAIGNNIDEETGKRVWI